MKGPNGFHLLGHRLVIIS